MSHANIRPTVILILIIVGVAVSAYVFFNHRTVAFASQIKVCNQVPSGDRFSCYRKTLEDFGTGKSISEYMSSIENNKDLSFKSVDQSYAIFGTNCHTFYHAEGDYIATHASEKDLPTLTKFCSASCTGGCVMGLYKRVALENKFATSTLAEYYKICPEPTKHQCAHEIGHVLHDKYTTSILKIVDNISIQKYGLKPAMDYTYTTYNKPDLNQPFADCNALVPKAELAYCYSGVGHNLFLFSEFDPAGYKTSFAECQNVKPENQDDCYGFLVYRIGINQAATRFLSNDSKGGQQVCTDTVALAKRPNLERHCYLGIGGGIGLYLDSEYARMDITSLNLTTVQQDILDIINLCGLVTKADDSQECYKGILGTGAKKLYQKLNLDDPTIEKLLHQIDDAFEVVG